MKKTIFTIILVLLLSTSLYSANKLILTYDNEKDTAPVIGDGIVEMQLDPSLISNVKILQNGDVEITTNLTATAIGNLLPLDLTPLVDSTVSLSSITSIPSGTSTTINWTNNTSTVSCDRDGGEWGTTTGGTLSPDSSYATPTFTYAANNTSVEYMIKCTNGASGDLSLDTIIIPIQNPSVVNCPSEQPPLSLQEDRSIIANGTSIGGDYDGTFKGFFSTTGEGSDWPGVQGTSITLSITKNQYVAAEFTTNSTIYDNGKLKFSGPNATQGTPSLGTTMAISECPGDFDVALGQDTCSKTSSSLFWSTDPSVNDNGIVKYCILDINKKYYLNIIHSNNPGVDGLLTSDCPSTYCGFLAGQTF